MGNFVYHGSLKKAFSTGEHDKLRIKFDLALFDAWKGESVIVNINDADGLREIYRK